MLIRSLLLCLFLYSSTISQTLIEQNVGSWTGVLSKNNPFSFTIFLQQENSGLLTVHVKGQKTDITLTLRPLGQQNIYGADINAYLYVKVRLGNNSKNPDMFLQNGQVLSHINLVQMGQNSWQGSWDLFLVKDFDPTFYLSLEKVSDTEYAAYGFYRASQNQTMYCQNFSFRKTKFNLKIKTRG